MGTYLRQNSKSPRTGVSIPIHIGTSPTSQHANQSLQKSFHHSNADKIELKKISSPSELRSNHEHLLKI